MNRLIKELNRQNGNLCFASETDSRYYIVECDRYDRSISYATAATKITGICTNNQGSYYVAFSNNYIGLFENGILNATYADTLVTSVDRLVKRSDNIYYALDRSSATIYRFSSFSPLVKQWEFQVYNPLEDYQGQGEIFVRESDDALIYYDCKDVYLIGDMQTEGTVIYHRYIGGDNCLFVESTGEFNPECTFLRWRQVTGESLEWSSSSSSSSSFSSISSLSTSSSSSESSSSQSYSSSSSSSQDSSSSSSVGESSSSSSS